jgi:hypothetical protein
MVASPTAVIAATARKRKTARQGVRSSTTPGRPSKTSGLAVRWQSKHHRTKARLHAQSSGTSHRAK